MGWFTQNIHYVRVSENFVVCRNVSTGVECRLKASAPFTTERLLIGTFQPAVDTLTEAVRKTRGRTLMPLEMVIQPIEKVEGGLSEVEDRLFKETAANAGSKKTIVHAGRELSDQEVMELIVGT